MEKEHIAEEEAHSVGKGKIPVYNRGATLNSVS